MKKAGIIIAIIGAVVLANLALYFLGSAVLGSLLK